MTDLVSATSDYCRASPPFSDEVIGKFRDSHIAALNALSAHEKLVDALEQIANAHLGDCPAAMTEVDHARAHVFHLRKIAAAALAA